MKVILANGVFDPCHYGHLLHLRAARAMGGFLVVAVTSDEAVRKERGEGRPMFNERQRADMLMEMRCVDQTWIVPDPVSAMAMVNPQIFVKGPDYAGKITPEVAAYCKRKGIEIRFTAAPKWSATDIVRELRRG